MEMASVGIGIIDILILSKAISYIAFFKGSIKIWMKREIESK